MSFMNKPLWLALLTLYLVLLSLVGGSLALVFPDVLTNLPATATLNLTFIDAIWAFLKVLFTFSIDGIPYLVTLFFVYLPSIITLFIMIEYAIEFLKLIF